MTLSALQKGLEHLYAVETGLDVDDFLVDERALPDEGLLVRGETLLVREDPDGSAEIGLWIDSESVARLGASPSRRWIDDALLPDLCKAVEGVSHFVYLAYRAAEDRPVSLFDLELQAEVDKFALAALLAREHGGGAAEISALRVRLFDEATYLDDADVEHGARYRRASRFAARLAGRLAGPLSRPSGRPEAFDRLRRFYRLGAEEKMRFAVG